MLDPSDNLEYPDVPSKRYFTIGEVSTLCHIKTHVLRYWEQEFPQLKPVKRRGNRRYYQRRDILLIREIRDLLYGQGYTIGGAKQKLVPQNHHAVTQPGDRSFFDSVSEIRVELEAIKQILSGQDLHG
ncbi:MAG: MerR family transcriptional regulator [Gammaproteobacteria bacterium]|nr:MerR family transcriptional regulator [Pseudomonadota bacterium]MCH9662888.1 MerR family transcriptional regulator [Gammaproteobacteria bacterium]